MSFHLSKLTTAGFGRWFGCRMANSFLHHDNTIKYWDTSNASLLIATSQGHTGSVNALATSSDGKLLASASSMELPDSGTHLHMSKLVLPSNTRLPFYLLLLYLSLLYLLPFPPMAITLPLQAMMVRCTSGISRI
jgi:WD40 repeat protein